MPELKGFNPRARRGRDRDELDYWQARLRAVSIHAPAGGATALGVDYYQLESVSIHAPAGGATVRHC